MSNERKFGNPELIAREFSLYPEYFKLIGKEFRDALSGVRISVSEYGWCDIRERDLTTARDEELLYDGIEGNFIGYIRLTGTASFRLNNPQSVSISFSDVPALYGIPFKRVYLTNVAQSGETLKLLIGKGDFKIERTEMAGIDLQAQYTATIDSTTTPLGAGASWTSSDWFDAANYGYITVLQF